MSRRFGVAAVAIMMLARGLVTSADDVKMERDAKGALHIRITGEKPPAEESQALPAGEDQTSRDQMSVKVSLRRTQIEKQLNAAAAELAATRAAIRETREKKFSELEAVATFPSATDGLVLAAQVATAEAEFKEKQRQKLEALGADERSELKRIDGLYADLDRLRSEVRSAYPEPPSWWRDKVDCAACPSPADVADALR